MTDPFTSTTSGSRLADRDTVVSRFWDRVDTQPARPALRHMEAGSWRALTWGDYGVAVGEQAAGLLALGIGVGDRVGLLAGNSPQWHIADLSILAIGAISVPVYPTSSSSQVQYVLEDSGVRCCFVGDTKQLAKLSEHREHLPGLEHIIVMDAETASTDEPTVQGLAALRTLGRTHLVDDPRAVRKRSMGLRGADIATLVYTSGTTGPPKGAVLTHHNIAWTVSSVNSMVDLGPDDRFFSYLPLSHIAERITSHFGQIIAGGETWFARGLVTVPDDLRDCHPTVFFAVPRVWQKFHDAILHQIADQRPLIRRLMERYIDVGLHREAQPSIVRRWVDGGIYLALDRTIGARLRAKIGLDRARIVVSSAAPIHPDLVRWFHAIGVRIGEVWGQTEDCGPATMNPPDAIRIGTTGVAIPGLDIKTGADGELFVRGGSVCAGYFGHPVSDLVDVDGWMPTGDLGSIDADGYVTITGRKKDLIINAAGKNISPAEIEGLLQVEPVIGEAIVVGDGRKYLVALLAPDLDELHALGLSVADPALSAEIDAAVDRVNKQHAPVEQIKAWRLIPTELTVEGGDVTPTLKVRRSAIVEKYMALVEEMYAT